MKRKTIRKRKITHAPRNAEVAARRGGGRKGTAASRMRGGAPGWHGSTAHARGRRRGTRLRACAKGPGLGFCPRNTCFPPKVWLFRPEIPVFPLKRGFFFQKYLVFPRKWGFLPEVPVFPPKYGFFSQKYLWGGKAGGCGTGHPIESIGGGFFWWGGWGGGEPLPVRRPPPNQQQSYLRLVSMATVEAPKIHRHRFGWGGGGENKGGGERRGQHTCVCPRPSPPPFLPSFVPFFLIIIITAFLRGGDPEFHPFVQRL